LKVKEFLDALEADDSLSVEFPSPDRPVIQTPELRTREWAHYVLSVSERPLTPEEIIDRAQKLLQDLIDPPSPRGLANMLHPVNGFYLLAAGAFGLRHHFSLPEKLWAQARSAFHKLLESENRPISTAEVISEGKFECCILTNKYELAQILREDKCFTDLGRFLFALAKWGVEERQHIKELIPRVLCECPHPVTTSEISSRLRSLRSVTPTSIANILQKHPEVYDYGYGYYGLKCREETGRIYLISNPRFINRVIARTGPPLTLARLCNIVGVVGRSDLMDKLWRTVRRLRHVSAMPHEPTLETLLICKTWSLERSLYNLLETSERPLPVYEIQWELNRRFGPAFSNRTLEEVEKGLQRSRLFIRTAKGEYLVDTHSNDPGFDARSIREAAGRILAESWEILGCDDLLERLSHAGIITENLSPTILASILRRDEAFDEIGYLRFRKTP
jgi:hypothetical protein